MTDSRSDEIRRRLVHVKYAVAAVGEAEHSLRDAVTRARSVGATWPEVAEALGLPAETVRARFDRPCDRSDHSSGAVDGEQPDQSR